jgi:Fe-S-cluster containining protein
MTSPPDVPPRRPPAEQLSHPLLAEHAATLDRLEALLLEDQAQRAEQFENPDPARRRLKVACNDCTSPWCCYQRVTVDFAEALLIYRHAAQKARPQLEAAFKRAKELRHERGKERRLVTKDGKPPPPWTDDDDAYFRHRLPCPFLQHGRCTVYPVRPDRCRTHYMQANPQKCRDELTPSETYAMDPSARLKNEIAEVKNDLQFFAQVKDMVPVELAEVLLLIESLRGQPLWDRPRTLEFPASRGDDQAGGRGVSRRRRR